MPVFSARSQALDGVSWVQGGEIDNAVGLVSRVRQNRRHRLLSPSDQLELGQAQQVAGVVEAFGCTLTGELVVLAQEGRQLESLQMMGGQHLGHVGHDVASASELQSHYLFADRFGRPGKGNDKGKVEGLIGLARRNYLVPRTRRT
jgi:hypothetical protein